MGLNVSCRSTVVQPHWGRGVVGRPLPGVRCATPGCAVQRLRRNSQCGSVGEPRHNSESDDADSGGNHMSSSGTRSNPLPLETMIQLPLGHYAAITPTPTGFDNRAGGRAPHPPETIPQGAIALKGLYTNICDRVGRSLWLHPRDQMGTFSANRCKYRIVTARSASDLIRTSAPYKYPCRTRFLGSTALD